MTKTIYKILICLTCVLLLVTCINAQDIRTMLLDSTKESNMYQGKLYDNDNSVKAILEIMDSRMNRNSLQNVKMEVIDEEKKTEYLFSMKAKDNNQKLILRYYYPDSWKGTNLLMIKEDIWIYDRNADRFMQVPRAMAFGGTDVAHGDMMRLNISNNYDGEIIAEDDTTWTLKLITTNKSMPYYGIEIVIDKEGYYPIDAVCFSKSGKHIKTIEYSELRELNGVVKPTKYTFLSPYEPDEYNIVTILDEKLAEYPDFIFNKWAMKNGVDEEY